MKIRETSEIRVIHKNTELKGGFVDLSDAHEFVVNELDDMEKNSILLITQNVWIRKTSD